METQTALFIFHDQLQDVLPAFHRGDALPQVFKGSPSVKHFVEALGVPHTEVGAVLITGEEASLTSKVQAGDQVDVYPALPGAGLDQLDLPEGKVPGFVLDNHLGKLAVYLRILGFDCLYDQLGADAELARIAARRERILLTRDKQLLMRKVVCCGYWVRSKLPEEQTLEVLRRFDLADHIRPFHRCLRCNTPLGAVAKEQVLERLEPLTRRYYDEFYLCPACDQIYWQGSHYERMRLLVERVLK